MIRRRGSLVEEVRYIPNIAVFNKRGRINLQELLKIVATKYQISKEPNDYVFLVVKACHADEPNNNGDGFTLAELNRFDYRYGCKVYQTFVGKPHFAEHNQEGKVYGVICDAHLERPAEGKPYVELVIAVDATKDPVYGQRVRDGKVRNKFSMGCTVDFTECSICRNKAYTEDEFCEHIRFGKMKNYRTASGELKMAFEWCYGVCYDELSNVEDPADPKAIEEERLFLAASTKKVSTVTCPVCGVDREVTCHCAIGDSTCKDKTAKTARIVRVAADSVSNSFGFEIKVGDQVITPVIRDRRTTFLGGGLVADVEAIDGENILLGFDNLNQDQLVYKSFRNEDKSESKKEFQRVPLNREDLEPEIETDTRTIISPGVPKPIIQEFKYKVPGYATYWPASVFHLLSENDPEKGIDYIKKPDDIVRSSDKVTEPDPVFPRPKDVETSPGEGITFTPGGDEDIKEFVRDIDPSILQPPAKISPPMSEEQYKKFLETHKYQGVPYKEYLEQHEKNLKKRMIRQHMPEDEESSADGQYEKTVSGRKILKVSDTVETVPTPAGYNTLPQADKEEMIRQQNEQRMKMGLPPDPNMPLVEPVEDWRTQMKPTMPEDEESSADGQYEKTVSGRKISKAASSTQAAETGSPASIPRGTNKPEDYRKNKRVVTEDTNYGKDSLHPTYKFEAYLDDKSGENDNNVNAIKGGDKMSKREYFIAEMDKSASGIKFPGYKSWKIQVQDFNNTKMALLTDGKDKVYKKALDTKDEREFASSVFGDLVKQGLTYTVKKYGFTPKFKAITEDGTVDKDPGQLKPNNDRISADGVTDKEGYAAGKAEGAITDNGTLDKEDPGSYSGKTSPALKASTEKKAEEKPAEKKADEVATAPAAETVSEEITNALDKAAAEQEKIAEVKEEAAKKDKDEKAKKEKEEKKDDRKASTEKAAEMTEEAKSKAEKEKADKKKKDDAKKKKDKMKKKNSYIKVGKLAEACVDLYSKYLGMPAEKGKSAVVELFSNGLKIEGEGELDKFAEGIEENKENIDTEGLAQEVVTSWVEDEEKTPEQVAEEFEKFVSEDAPPEVKEEISTDVKDIAESVSTESAIPGEEISAPADVMAPPAEEEKPTGEESGIKIDELDMGAIAAKEAPKTAAAPAPKVKTEEKKAEEKKAETVKSAEEMSKEAVAIYQKRYARALRVAATRQLLNIEPKGLFKIKEALCEHLITPNGRFAGVKNDIAVDLIERAFRNIIGSKTLDDLLASAEKLTGLSDDAFLQIEADTNSLMPVNVINMTSGKRTEAKKDASGVLAKTGSDLLQGGSVDEKEIRDALPGFGIGIRKENK